MAERRIRWGLVALVFIPDMLLAAWLLSRPETWALWVGIALLAAPMLVFAAVGLAYYLASSNR